MDSAEVNNEVPLDLAQSNSSAVESELLTSRNRSDDEPEVVYIRSVAVEPPVPVINQSELIEVDSNSAVGNLDQNAECMEIDPGNSRDEDVETRNWASDTEEDTGSQCTICYSSYTNSGDHRLCCLKCGHLFGKSCIVHWLKTNISVNRKCPTCNEKASLRDVRVLYAKTLIALDTSEKDRLLKRLEKTEQEKSRLESSLNNMNSKVQMLQEKIKMYEVSIKQLKENPHYREQIQPCQKSYAFSVKLITSFKLSDRGCRVLALSKSLSLMLATQESGNPLFPGFGVRKINMQDMRPVSYQNNLHKKEIRDMSFSYHDRSNLLTVSSDCTAKLYDVQSNVVIQTFTVPEPLWSCSYHILDSHKFYCGSQKGTIFVFDRRYFSNEPERIIELPDSKTGILSLCSIPPRPGRFMPNGGIMACRLTSVIAIYPTGNDFETTVLPIEGSFLSMRYNELTDNLLISARPSKNFLSPRHIICQLSKLQSGEPRNNFVDILHTFHGARSPKVLSRSTFIPTPNGDQLVCAYNERDTCIDAWSMISETKFNTRDAYLPDPVLDICSFQSNDQEVTVPCLSESKLSIIKFGFES